MPKLIILRGLQGCGKTTYALEAVKKSKGTLKRVNKDSIRDMVDAGVWSADNEKEVIKTHDSMVLGLLEKGYDVIVDNTHLHPKYDDYYQKLLSHPLDGLMGISVEFKTFDTPLDECLRRDAARAKPVGRKVLMDAYNRYLKPPTPKQIPHDESLPDAVVSDIDGTVADHEGLRSPYDWASVGLDRPKPEVIKVINELWVGPAIEEDCRTLIMLSGRDETCRPQTLKWLNDHNIPVALLLMRPAGDTRKDDIVKKELYENHIKGKFNVVALFDDRLRVRRMWYSLGLPLFSVGDPDADF